MAQTNFTSFHKNKNEKLYIYIYINNFEGNIMEINFRLQFCLFFSNDLQIARTTLHGAFTLILKSLQHFELSYLGFEMTNINLWVLLSLFHNFLYFSQMICKCSPNDLENP
jgi:hypothetical protein